MTKQKHTGLHSPLPWLYRGFRIRDNEGFDVAYMTLHPEIFSDAESAADAAFIVKAVNNHEKLVEAITALRNSIYMLAEPREWPGFVSNNMEATEELLTKLKELGDE